jgi:rfaE bifunctional protein nucleotidyltransferase chain/domain/rfaE bifunctional protein kinase chain/domain
VVGDCLLDRDVVGRAGRLAPDAPVPVLDELAESERPGGAGLAALLLAADGHPVTLVTALAPDDAGHRLAVLLAAAGVTVVDLVLDGATPQKVRIRTDGRSLVRLDRSAGGRVVGPLPEAGRRALATAAAVLVSDYGRGVAGDPSVRAEIGRLRRTPVVWDPHPRGADPLPGARLVTPNAAEAEAAVPEPPGTSLAAVAARGRALVERWRASAVAITLGGRGAMLVADAGTPPLVSPAELVPLADTCGAGDRFAAAATVMLGAGALPSEAVTAATETATAFVAAGGAGSVTVPGRIPECAAVVPAADGDAHALVRRVRARGGTVVATGGCFDLLHAGHVEVLRAARALGDCLVVCLNSDDSVRRLKGPDRPIVPAADRAAVLRSLDSVDAVVTFDEDAPVRLLAELAPDVFAKGGDYAVADLPEAGVVAAWGGQAVVLPYLAGRSTTSMIKDAVRRGTR